MMHRKKGVGAPGTTPYAVGNQFWLNWDQEGQKPKKSYQSMKAAGPAPAARPKIGQLCPKSGLGASCRFWGIWGTPKILPTSLRSGGISFKNACEFQSGVGMGSWEPWEKPRSTDAGSAALSFAQWQSQGPRRGPKIEKRTPNDANDASPLGRNSFCQASRLPVPTGPGLMGLLNEDVGTTEAITSLRELYGGLAMGISMDGVMGCRIHGGFMQVFCGFIMVL